MYEQNIHFTLPTSKPYDFMSKVSFVTYSVASITRISYYINENLSKP